MGLSNINPYNYKNQVKRFFIYLVILNLIETGYLLSSHFFPKSLLGVSPPLIFFLILLYIILWYFKLKTIEHQEQLRQIRLSLSRTNNREYERYTLPKDEILRVSFCVVVRKFFLEYKKKKRGKIIDISEGGLQLFSNCSNDKVGDEAIRITFNLAEGKQIIATGIIVKRWPTKCTVKFSEISDRDKKNIAQFIFSKSMKECNEAVE